MTEGSPSVLLEIRDGVAWIRFNRAPVNAIDWPMLLLVRERFAQAIDDPAARVIVLASALPKYFSAGADLAAFRNIGRERMRQWASDCHALVRLMRNSPKPLLAAINGTAVGGGLEMTLHCDLRFAAANARLGQPEIAISFIPPVGATQALARLIGRPRAIRYLYDGKLVEAKDALEWGLVDELAPPEELHARVQQYARELAAKPAPALAAIRRTITLGGGMSFEDGLALELETAATLAETRHFDEGVDAFLAKRKPNWPD
ncbi:MAG: enoyl-CoA hydratase/isomerase family protein [Reyranellaceae bacterium]